VVSRVWLPKPTIRRLQPTLFVSCCRLAARRKCLWWREPARAPQVREAIADLLDDQKALGSLSRHAPDASTRLRALARVTDEEELLKVALKSEHTDAAVAALERIDAADALTGISQRARNKVAARRARTKLRDREEPQLPPAESPSMSSADRQRAVELVQRAEALVAMADPDEATAKLADVRLAWAEFQADVVADPALEQQFESASDAVREAIAERQQERVAEQQRAEALAREQADRIAICNEIENLSGDTAMDRIAELKVQWDGLPPMPSEYAASLTRRFQDACRAFEDRERRRMLAQAAAGRLETLATELEQLLASAQPLEEIVARWRGLRRDADVLREHVSANPEAGARLEQAIAAIEQKEHDHQQQRQKLEQDNLKRLQQVARQVETLAAAEQISLKAGDRALRDIRMAIDDRAPLPSKKDRQELQARLEAARAKLAPRVQELRDADEWQRWANLQVQEELCKEMEALKTEENLDTASRRMRELQGRWKQVALAPRAQGEAMWRRFKSAQDEVFARTSAHLAVQNEERAKNLAAKIALCERAEALADSTDWVKTGRGNPGTPGGMEDDWPRQPWAREGRLGAIPRGMRQVLHAQAGGPQAPQGGMVGQPGEEGSAVRTGRSAGRLNGLGERRRATQAAPGRVEDGRTRAEVEIRSGLAALPRRVRSLLRSLQAPRSACAAGEGGRARHDHPRPRGSAAAQRSTRG
jgi:Arc/MetJ-type ribon-helix-helix transcriptional regulator